MTLEHVYNQANQFLEQAFAELVRQNFVIAEHWQIDHLCYRTSTEESYRLVKNQFAEFSQLLIESQVNGRLIATFKLPRPIVFKDYKIELIEVPAPKSGKKTKDGFEHFEVVCDLSFEKLKERYHPFKFDESGLSKKINPELEFCFDNFALKFHHSSLEEVIKTELKTII